MSKIEIITPRLVLRSPVPEDAEILQRAKEQMWPELQRWMSWAFNDRKPLKATREYLASSAARRKGTVLLGFLRDGSDLAISTGLDHLTADDYVIGYWVAQPHLGKGYAAEAVNAALRYAFGALKASSVEVDYCEGNEKSAAIIRKLGFTPVKTVKDGHHRPLDGKLIDVHHFRRTNADGLPELEVSWTGTNT